MTVINTNLISKINVDITKVYNRLMGRNLFLKFFLLKYLHGDKKKITELMMEVTSVQPWAGSVSEDHSLVVGDASGKSLHGSCHLARV